MRATSFILNRVSPGLLMLAALALLPLHGLHAQDTGELKTRMNAAGNAVERARAFPRYGEAILKEARTAANNGDYEKAEKILTEYRDTVKQLHEALRGSVPNPEKKPNGFKQLQIHVRKAIRDLEDLVASVPANLQPPFDFLRKEIERLDKALIDDLFPRQPGRDEKEKKGKQ